MGKTAELLLKMAKSRTFYLMLFAAAMVAATIFALAGISRQADENQVEFLQNAVRRSAVQCYALEGRFPNDIKYLEENYSLIVDRSRYNVYYEYMGGNLIPQIWVFPIGEGG